MGVRTAQPIRSRLSRHLRRQPEQDAAQLRPGRLHEVRRYREGTIQAMSAQVPDAGAPLVPLNTTDAGVAMDYFRNAYGTSLKFSGLRDGPVYVHTRLDA